MDSYETTMQQSLLEPAGEESKRDMFSDKENPPSTGKMTKVFCKLAVPAVSSNVMAFISVVVNTIFAGRMNDPAKLAAVGLANVCHAIMILSLMVGLNAAQETLTSQAFGSGSIELCSVYLNRGRFILLTFFIPLALVPAFFAESILSAIGQDAEVSKLTQSQIWVSLPSVFFYGNFDLVKRWLGAMRITLVPMVAMLVATILHLPLCFLFVHFFDMDIRGLAMASTVKDFVLLLTVMVYCSCSSQIKPTYRMPDREAFRGWGEYLSISLPVTVMICAEWWAFELLTILAGNIGVEEQASQVLLTSLGAILFNVPLGVQQATCSLIGNCIGAGNVPLAKRFFWLILKISSALVLSIGLLILLARKQIVEFFTVDETVRQICTPICILLAFNFLFDGTQTFLQGPIRAIGLQQQASYFAIGCYYLAGIPSACLIGLWAGKGVIGFEAGFGIALYIQCCAFALLLKRTDWQKIADSSKQRIKKEKEELDQRKIVDTDDDFTK